MAESAESNRNGWLALGPIGLSAALSTASYLKSDWTRNDFERFDNLWLTSLFFVLLVAAAAAYFSLWRTRPQVTARTRWIGTLGALALLLASFPVGSKDVFGYAFFGKIWGQYRANPYLATPADFPNDEWQPYVQVRWHNEPTKYGPFFLWQTRLVNAIAGNHLWAAVGLHKLVAALAFIGCLITVQSLAAGTLIDGARLLLLGWNPLFLFETAGNAHNDVVIVLLLLLALWCWQREKPEWGLALLAVGFWYKWYSALFAVALVIETFKQRGARATVRHSLVALVPVVIISVLAIAPFTDAASEIIATVLHPTAVQGIYPNELSPTLALLFWPLASLGVLEAPAGMTVFDATRFGLFALSVAIVLYRQWRAPQTFAALVESCVGLALAFFLWLVTMLLPWHLLSVVALALLAASPAYVAVAIISTVLGLASYFLTFAVATLALVACGVAIWAMRSVVNRTVRSG